VILLTLKGKMFLIKNICYYQLFDWLGQFKEWICVTRDSFLIVCQLTSTRLV